jgi:hypothetical protein
MNANFKSNIKPADYVYRLAFEHAFRRQANNDNMYAWVAFDFRGKMLAFGEPNAEVTLCHESGLIGRLEKKMINESAATETGCWRPFGKYAVIVRF